MQIQIEKRCRVQHAFVAVPPCSAGFYNILSVGSINKNAEYVWYGTMALLSFIDAIKIITKSYAYYLLFASIRTLQ